MNGMTIVQLAKQNLAQITGLTPDTVAAFHKDDEGWHVSIIMVELKRIPNSKDMLATYECLLDEEGNLISYQRVQRYLRDQTLEKEAA